MIRELTQKEKDVRLQFPNITLEVPRLELIPSYIVALKNGFFDYKDISFKHLEENNNAKDFLTKINSGRSWNGENSCVVRWLMDGGVFLGRVRIKNFLYDVNHPIFKDMSNFIGGHIGYSIAPEHRGKGLSVLQLSLALDELSLLSPNLDVSFHSINRLNQASVKATIACGFEKYNSFVLDGNDYDSFQLSLKRIENN